MAQPALKSLTVTDFLEWDSGDDRRYELSNGEIVAMAPPNAAHRVVAGNFARRLSEALDGRPPCTVQTEAGVVPRDRDDTYHQADLVVTCEPVDPEQLMVGEPLVVVEVLSSSTEDHDRKVKLPDYRALPSVAEVVLIDPLRFYCEVHRRFEGDRWLTDLVREPDAKVQLPSIGFDQPLSVLYARVPL